MVHNIVKSNVIVAQLCRSQRDKKSNASGDVECILPSWTSHIAIIDSS